MLHGAGKWITAGLTTLAALFALLVNAKNLGLNAWLGSMGLGFADYAAARVTVLPRADSLFAIGDSLGLAATVTDRRGAVLVGASIRWASDDSSVATVDSSGIVIARGPGTARITVSVRELLASARVTVRQAPMGLRIEGDTLVRVREGDTVALAARVLDARAHLIRDARPAWHVSDTSVIAVDSTGTAVARAPGRAVLTASLGQHRARVALDVALAPARLALLSGAEQRGPAGRPLSQPVSLRVLSRGGAPVPGTAVVVAAADGEGAVEPDTAITDRAGRATVRWTLGPRPGRQRVVAQAPGLDTAVVVLAEADPIRGNTRVESDSVADGRVGEALGAPVAIRVTDSAGAALSDLPVAWTALDGSAVQPLAPRTDSLGQASAHWTLGPRTGPQRLRVQVGNPRTLPPVTVVTTALPAPPAALALASGAGQRGTVGLPLAKPVVVTVRDAQGNPVPGVPVTARAVQGSVADSAILTDARGRAAIQWSLGRAAGRHRLELRVAGVDTVVAVTALARPGAPANLAFRDPPARGTTGTPLRLSAAVSDAYGNPVSDALVVFGAAGGSLSATRVMSDTTGAAATRWTAPATPGEQTLTATLRGTTIRATHTVRVIAPAATRTRRS
ncbi:MAG TPA: Ig-like domain-containing protein [Gemmatimonadales bacterium]|nr:Ig-like domain-containing protein [Gemmatimonadales bacterium]